MENLTSWINNNKNEANKQEYKIGKTVKGTKALVPAKNGKEETGLIIYKRKVEYRFNG